MSASIRPSARYTPVAVLAVTLFVFALVVAYVTLWLRSGLRSQILGREGEALTAVASLQLTTEADTLHQLGLGDDPGELLNAVLRTSKLRGVFAVRVFDSNRRLNGALPYPWSEQAPPDSIWAMLLSGQPVTRLHARESAAEVIGLAPTGDRRRTTEPLLETWLPLHRADSAALAGAAQMWTDGHAIATEFRALDVRLAIQAVLAWAAGAVIIATLLGWAFRRLAATNRELKARTEDLLRANRELTLAAKTSAIGAVAAHLVHELKNPIAGLEEFVAMRADAGLPAGDEGELAAASELTRRLRTIVNDVVQVMRDENGGATFTLTCADVVELAIDNVRTKARTRGIEIRTQVSTVASMDGRRGNLARLVLQNLLHNAIDAVEAGQAVRLCASTTTKEIVFAVADEGTGLPLEVRERLFQPCTSRKRGGTGIGLALSKQLARQAGGDVRLLRSDTAGTTFELVLEQLR